MSKFNLDKWRLQLPVNNNGGFSGSMRIVNPAKTVKPWFVAYEDRLDFVCPVVGATSSGSKYPRTELAENATWGPERPGLMTARMFIKRIPSGGITIAQVWGEKQPLRLVAYVNGTILAEGEGVAKPAPRIGKFQYWEPFTFSIHILNSRLTLLLNDVEVFSRGLGAWSGKKLYFKAGTYCHADPGTDPALRFKATFTDLKISH